MYVVVFCIHGPAICTRTICRPKDEFAFGAWEKVSLVQQLSVLAGALLH